MLKELKGIAGKAKAQIQKDYVAWPLLSGLAMAALDLAINARKLGAEDRAAGSVACAEGCPAFVPAAAGASSTTRRAVAASSGARGLPVHGLAPT